MAVPPAPDDQSGLTPNTQPDHDSPTAAPAASAGPRRLIAALLVLVIVVSGALFGWLLSQRSGETDRTQAEREKVMSQARNFIVRVNTYGPDLLAEDGTMPDYRSSVLEVITPKFAASFEESVPAAEATVAQAGFSRTGEVFGAGVAAIDADSATALVAGSFLNSYPDPSDDSKRVEDVPLPFRVQIQLVKVDGTWLVDSFAPVTGEPEPTDIPSAPVAPSGAATTSPEPSDEASQ